MLQIFDIRLFSAILRESTYVRFRLYTKETVTTRISGATHKLGIKEKFEKMVRAKMF